MKKIDLDEIDKKTPFIVPEGYFENLSQKIVSGKTAVNKGEFIPDWNIPRLAIAASLTGILITIFYLNFEKEPTWESELSQVDTEDIIIYLANSELTDYELIEDYVFLDEEFSSAEEMIDLELDEGDLDLLYLEYDI